MQYSIDIDLWNRFRGGDKRAVYDLYNHYYNDLIRYGLKITDDADLTKELINGLFFDLWRSCEKLPESNSPKAYIITSFKNKILQHKRKKQPLTIVSEEQAPLGNSLFTASVEETVIELQEYTKLKQQVEKVLSSLTERQQQLIKLRFIEEMSYEEIAGTLSISVRTVYNSIHESMKMLKKEFEGITPHDFFYFIFFYSCHKVAGSLYTL